MYTLRQIDNGIEINTNLGESYIVIKRENDRSGAEFNKALAKHYGKEVGESFCKEDTEEAMRIHAFVFDDGGSNLYALWQKKKYFIMTETGNTFDNLTFR